MNHLHVISREELDRLISKRPGETKLGETIHTLDASNWEAQLQTVNAPFVLLGIPEDIGVRANLGVGGTHTVWMPALKAILNVQDTALLQGSKVVLLGAFDFSELMKQSEQLDVNDLRALVNTIDDIVYPVIQTISRAGKIPIIIGGGHNNAYPILKGISRARGKSLNCINLDAHSDYLLAVIVPV